MGLAIGLSAGLAGCSGEEDGEETTDLSEDGGDQTQTESSGDGGSSERTPVPDPPEPDGNATLAIIPENGDGELTEIGFDLTITHQENLQQVTRSYVGDWQGEVEIDGELQTLGEDGEWAAARIRADQPQLQYAGAYDVVIEANEANDFETVEDTVEFSEGDLKDQVTKEKTYTLKGATSDKERQRQNAVVIEDQHHLDGKHDPSTEWAIGVQDGSTEPGTRVVQQEWSDEDHQKWDIEPVDEEGKWHRLTASHTDNLVMEADTGIDSDLDGYTELFTAEWNESDAQLFRFVPLDETHPFVEEGEEVYKVVLKGVTGRGIHQGPVFGPAGGEAEADLEVVTWWYAGAGDQMQMLSPHS